MDGNTVIAADTQPNVEDAEEAQLRAALDNDADAQADDTTKTDKAESQEADSPEKSDTGADTAVKDQKAEVGTAEATDTRSSEQSADDPKSSYQARVSERDRLAEDQKRLAENWKRFDEGKLKWQEALNAKLASLEQQLAQSRQQPAQQAPTPEEYISAAKEFEKKAREATGEGDLETAQKYLNLAAQSRDAGQQSYFQRQHAAQQQQASHYEATWIQNMNAELDRHPELADPNSDDAKLMMQLLQEYPIFESDPHGFSYAIQILQMRKEAAERSALREKLEQEQKSRKELEQKTQLKSGGVTTHAESKEFDRMSEEEQETFLRNQARQADYAPT